jgi:peptide/nickel transport system substrate-binding protein
VHVELNVIDRRALYDAAKQGKSALFLVGWNFSSGEASEFYEFCLHTVTDRFGFSNYGAYSSPTIDRIAETNAAVLDQKERRTLLEQAATVAMEDLPVLPLYIEDDIYGARRGVSFEPRADGEIQLVDITVAPR